MPGVIGAAAEVGTYPRDRSPEGVLDLAGNVQEWTDSMPPRQDKSIRITRGGNWEINSSELPSYMEIENDRLIVGRYFTLGVRCALPREPD